MHSTSPRGGAEPEVSRSDQDKINKAGSSWQDQGGTSPPYQGRFFPCIENIFPAAYLSLLPATSCAFLPAENLVGITREQPKASREAAASHPKKGSARAPVRVKGGEAGKLAGQVPQHSTGDSPAQVPPRTVA